MYDKTDNNMHDNEFEAKENKIWNKVACEQALLSVGKWSEPRENVRARGRGKDSLQPSLINFHFHPGLRKAWKLSPPTCGRLEKWQPPVK